MTERDPINPSYYQGFSNGAQVIDISEHLTSNGGQALQYVARSCRLDGNNKGDVVENLEKAKWFIDREIERVKGEASDREVQEWDGQAPGNKERIAAVNTVWVAPLGADLDDRSAWSPLGEVPWDGINTEEGRATR